MLNSNGIHESPDYCVVMGDRYREIRDEISKLLLIKEERINLKVFLLNKMSFMCYLFISILLILLTRLFETHLEIILLDQ